MYAPSPTTPSYDARYLADELAKIAQAIGVLASGKVPVRYEAPQRPRNGDIVLAQSPWNPGAGDGVYCYYSSAWNKL